MSIFSNISNLGVEEFVEDSSIKYQHGIFSNGIWQIRKEFIGDFTIKIKDVDGLALGLTKECSIAFKPNPSLPKIPGSIFNIILNHYIEIYNKMKSEVYTSIYWDKVKQDYFIDIPKQIVSGAQVNFENTPELLNNPDYILVCESHSHNVMGAFWSSQDLKDQKASRYFMVLGDILNEVPSTLLSVGSNQQLINIPLTELFDFSISKLHPNSQYEITTEMLENITEKSIVAPKNHFDYKVNYSFNKPKTSNISFDNKVKTINYRYSLNIKDYQDIFESFNTWLWTLVETKSSGNLNSEEFKDCIDDFITDLELLSEHLEIENIELKVEDTHSAYEDGVDCSQLGLSFEHAINFYNYEGKELQSFKEGYHSYRGGLYEY